MANGPELAVAAGHKVALLLAPWQPLAVPAFSIWVGASVLVLGLCVVLMRAWQLSHALLNWLDSPASCSRSPAVTQRPVSGCCNAVSIR